MSLYALSQRVNMNALLGPFWEIRAAATNKSSVLEIGLTLASGSACNMGLGRPAVAGVEPFGQEVARPVEDASGGAGLTTCTYRWLTRPTNPANYFRRAVTPNTVGVGVIFTFPLGLGLPKGGTVVLSSLASNGIVIWDIWAVVQE